MTAEKSRTQTWLGLIVVAVGLLPAAILGLHAYISATAPAVAHEQVVIAVNLGRSRGIDSVTSLPTSAGIVRALTERGDERELFGGGR